MLNTTKLRYKTAAAVVTSPYWWLMHWNKLNYGNFKALKYMYFCLNKQDWVFFSVWINFISLKHTNSSIFTWLRHSCKCQFYWSFVEIKFSLTSKKKRKKLQISSISLVSLFLCGYEFEPYPGHITFVETDHHFCDHFPPFCWCKKGSCQLLAKVYTLSTG